MIGLIEFNQQTQKKRNWLKTAAVGAGAIGAVAGGGMLLKKRLAKGVPAPKQPKPDVDTSGLDAARKKLMDNIDSLGSKPAANTPSKNPLSAETIAKRQANTARVRKKSSAIEERVQGFEGPYKDKKLRQRVSKNLYGNRGKFDNANTPTLGLSEASRQARAANTSKVLGARKKIANVGYVDTSMEASTYQRKKGKKPSWQRQESWSNRKKADILRERGDYFNRFLQPINFSFVRGPLANEQPRYSGGAVLLGGAGLHQAVNSAALGTGRRKTNISNKIGKGKSAAITGGLAAAALGGAAHLQNRRDKYLRQRGYKVKSHFAKGAATAKRFSSKKEQLK